jgi:hypothetical protein
MEIGQPQNESSASLLKSQYAAALLKRTATSVAVPADLRFASTPADDTKRRAAEERETERYLERLRFRLNDSGVSSGEIREIENAPEAALIRNDAPLAPRILQSARTAILVIHGIGEQNPYETLDQFARNLTRYLKHEGGIDDLTVSAQKIDHNDWVEAMVHLETKAHGPRTMEGHTSAHIDLYEYYWAPMTEDKISYKQTISWLIKTTLTPIRMLDQNIRAIKDEPDPEDLSRPAIFYRELWRIAMLYIPLAFVLLVMALWLPSALSLTLNLKDISKQIADHWSKIPLHVRIEGLGITLLLAISLAMYWLALKQLAVKWLRWFRNQDAMLDSSVTLNTFIAATVAASAGIGALLKSGMAQHFRPNLNKHALVAVGVTLLAFAVARVIQYFLAEFVGDVAVYVNADAKARNYAVRRAILNQAVAAITRILKDKVKGYNRVIVAGHSLGSVIAYDSLNELLNRCEQGTALDHASYATPDQIAGIQPAAAETHRSDLDKIKGLVTFGSPLDKVHYFFRDFVPDSQSIRSQILALLHSFRTLGPGRDYGIYRLQPYIADQLGNVMWLNAWSKKDPVSGMLHFFAPVIRRQFDYLIPIYAHLSYWEDLRFYAFFSEPLLLGAPPPPDDLKFKRAVA